MRRKNIFVFTSLSCKHTLKLSFAQHCPSAVGWWVRIMSVLVCGRPGDSQSKGHLPQQSFWLKTCAWLSTLTHFWSLNFRWFPSLTRGMKNHTGKLLSLTAMREKKFLSDMLCAFNQWSKTSMWTHFSSNHSGLLKTALFKIVYHSKKNQQKSVNCEPSSV